jgi:putative transposase
MKLAAFLEIIFIYSIQYSTIMYFKSGGIYHVYNQGNNRQVIFFKKENYFFFLRKIKTFILPFADVLAYCLMPNHFHLMISVNETEIPAAAIVGVTNSHPDNSGKRLTLNSSIGIMLRSYTRAINKQEKRSGALFREETKAICLNEPKWDSPKWYTSSGIIMMNVEIPDFQYPQVCYNYIHNNPVKSGFVEHPGEWQFSSFTEIQGKRNESLVNLEKVKEFGLLTG